MTLLKGCVSPLAYGHRVLNAHLPVTLALTVLLFEKFKKVSITSGKNLRYAPCSKFNHMKWDLSALKSVWGHFEVKLKVLMLPYNVVALMCAPTRIWKPREEEIYFPLHHSGRLNDILKFKYTVYINYTLNSHLNCAGTVHCTPFNEKVRGISIRELWLKILMGWREVYMSQTCF